MELQKEIRPYLVTTDLGVAIVNASSPDEAESMLKDKEGQECYMTWDMTKLKINPLPTEKGVVYYRPE